MEVKVIKGAGDKSYKVGVFRLPDSVSMEAVKRCMEILRKNPEASDIIYRKDYIGAVLWTEEDVKNCLEEKGFLPTSENISILLGDLEGLSECTDDHWEVIYGAIRDHQGELARTYPDLDTMEDLLKSVVEFMEADCVDLESAKDELMEMGFTEEQLRYFNFPESDGPKPLCFAATYTGSDIPEKVAWNLLCAAAIWFREDCCDEEEAREELGEIGFPEELIDAAWN